MFGQMSLLVGSLQHVRQKERTIVKVIVYFLMIALFAYRLNGSDLIPYQFCW